MDEQGIVLNKDIFEILSSDTRIKILKSLNSRKKTNSELAKELSLESSTIHHHLKQLDETGLITSLDTGNRWVYYELTPNGIALMNPDGNTKFSVILSSLITYTTAFAALYTYYTIPRLQAKPLFPHMAEDPFLLLGIIGVVAILLQTAIIARVYLKK